MLRYTRGTYLLVDVVVVLVDNFPQSFFLFHSYFSISSHLGIFLCFLYYLIFFYSRIRYVCATRESVIYVLYFVTLCIVYMCVYILFLRLSSFFLLRCYYEITFDFSFIFHFINIIVFYVRAIYLLLILLHKSYHFFFFSLCLLKIFF